MRKTCRRNWIHIVLLLTGIVCLMSLALLPAPRRVAKAQQEPEPGTGGEITQVRFGSVVPVVRETGLVSLSVDGLGSNNTSGIIQVEKPSGATVRTAYMAAASTGFSSRTLANGDVKIDGVGVVWSMATVSSISSFNHFADVTSMVKAKIDAAPAGRVNFTITEVNTGSIEGEILAVIFDDPNETTNNTVALLWGAQAVGGDTFALALADPVDKSDPNLLLQMSLGIGFGFQGGSQFSFVNVNGQRLSSSAGGQDDGQSGNGALLTVGGLDDSNTNPPPFASPSNPRTDDELYDLKPFVNNGDTSINVFTQNPSNDDNIFFAAFFLRATTAVVGEGIVLSPTHANNPTGAKHTITATLQNNNGQPIANRQVHFEIISGPNSGMTSNVNTDASGHANFSYTSNQTGADEIQASFTDSQGHTNISNTVIAEWFSANNAPIASCQNVTVSADGSCLAMASINNGSSDPDNDPITITQSPAGPYPLGNTLVTLTVSDDKGLTSQCNAVVTVVDDTRPTIAAPPNKTVNTDRGSCSASSVMLGSPVTADNCSIASVSNNAPALFPKGMTAVTWTVIDGSGNTSTATQMVTVEDHEAPVIGDVNNVVATLPCGSSNSMVVNFATPSATDSCPGVSVSASAPSSSVFPLGTTQVTVTAVDAAHNMATKNFAVTVLYPFSGFFQPIDNLPVVNVVQAGQAIPIKFSLCGYRGLNIFTPSYPISGAVSCDPSAAVDSVEETVTAGASTLTYDPGTDRYHYIWKTEKAWANSCRMLAIRLADGSERRALFSFKK